MKMPEADNKLDQAYKKAFEGFSKVPPPKIWAEVNKALWIKRLISFGILKPSQFIPFYSALTVLVTAGMLFVFKPHFIDNAVSNNDSSAISIQKLRKPADPASQDYQSATGNKHSLNNKATVNHLKENQNQPFNQSFNNNLNGLQNPVKNDESNVEKIEKQPVPNNLYTVNINSLKLPVDSLPPVVTQSTKVYDDIKSPSNETIKGVIPATVSINPTVVNVSDSNKTRKNLVVGDSLSKQEKPVIMPDLIVPAPAKAVDPITKFSLNIYFSTVDPVKRNMNPASSKAVGNTYYEMLLDVNKKSWSVTVLPEYHFGNYFVQAGLTFNKYQNTLLYSKQTSHFDTTNYLFWNRIWITDNKPPNFGHYEYFLDAIKVVDTSYQKNFISCSNSYNFIEVPLIAGYRFNSGKIDLKISTGASMGFYLSSKGKIFVDNAHELQDFNKNTLPINKFPVNFIFNAGLEYKLNDKFGVLIGAGFKYQINHLFEKSYENYNIRYYSSSLNFGLSYKLK